MEKLKSEGKCVFCDQMFTGSGMGRHLSGHIKEMENDSSTSGKAYHVKVSASEMFLHLLVGGACVFGELDHFLRAIWLECCGHMSSFQVKGKRYDFDWDDVEKDIGESMSGRVSKVFRKGVKLNYEYDFGSTTPLDIQVVNEYKIRLTDNILLLSRNEPLPILCHVCNKKPAVSICSVCIFDDPSLFCKSCEKVHKKSCEDFADYAKMPVVNSPRMGTCAYEGGAIDVQRDEVWKG